LAGRASQFNDRIRRRGTVSVVRLIPVVLGGFFMSVAVSSSSNFPWLGWLALIPLLRAVQVQAPLAACVSGGVWGLSIALFTRWSGQSVLTFGLSGFVLLSTLPALYAYVGARVTRRVGFNPLVLAVCWMPVEFLLRPVGLQHGLLASTQGDGVLLRVVGQFFGYALVAFVLAFVGAALLAMLSGLRLQLPKARSLGRIAPAGGVASKPVVLLARQIPISPSQPRAPPYSAFRR
jgi:apolipoprotein N-acyltransferase